ncbi:hypothetical protein HYG86_18005 [Alkalicella caledoniensis]|uniref:DUF4375 domain-containing protein n=1 Tax=Alkalicella caledoniensis TaxID=2731377 RepID=A0A7G9WCX0_ALKCA|nr:hypothetical protein [Alkalicella caledoniensis]QNO16532.1 hypothetical protein HYG86_18005 [Alkalicella caledoniensis]
MSRFKKMLSSPIFLVFLIFLFVFSFLRFTYVNKELKRERGSQAYYQLNDAKFLTRFIDMKLETDGTDSIDDDLLMHVNHLVYVSGRPLSTFEFLLQDGYQTLLRQLSSTASEHEKEQLVVAVEFFHEDLREIVRFANSECEIVLSRDEDGNTKSSKGDYINYAKLTDPNYRLYEEFNALVLQKIEDNRERLREVGK